MFVIYDQLHADHVGEFAVKEEALAALRRLASGPWDQPLNVAPCMSWRTCGRQYQRVEQDDTTTPRRTLGQEPTLEVSQAEVKWRSGPMSG